MPTTTSHLAESKLICQINYFTSEKKTVKVYPSPPITEDGFSSGNDLLKKAFLADGMTNLITNVEDPLVIAFNGVWGSGKTTFLKTWMADLQKTGHPVVFFDAFENDYVEDAFAALVRELIAITEQQNEGRKKGINDFKGTAVDLGAMLLRASGKIALKAAVRGATAGLVKSEEIQEVISDTQAEAVEIGEAYMNQLISNPRKQKDTAEAFKDALEKLPSLLVPPAEGEDQKPLIFIIDELDRCKPIFALAILERVKHFMSVPNIHFILGVNLRQLEGSVRFAYGQDIDAGEYLQKFVNLTIENVDEADRQSSSSLDNYAHYLESQLITKEERPESLRVAIPSIVRAIRRRGMNFRALERAYTILAISIAFTPKNYLQIGALIGGLVILKIYSPSLFAKAKSGTLKLEEVSKELHLDTQEHDPKSERSRIIEKETWEYALANEISEEMKQKFSQRLWAFDIDAREEIIQFTANEVVDRPKT